MLVQAQLSLQVWYLIVSIPDLCTLAYFSMCGSRKFCQRGFNFDNVFIEGIGSKQIPLYNIGADDGPTLNTGLVRGSGPVLLGNPYIFVIFQGGGGGPDPLPSPLDPRMLSCSHNMVSIKIS